MKKQIPGILAVIFLTLAAFGAGSPLRENTTNTASETSPAVVVPEKKPASTARLEMAVDFSKSQGLLRPLHGVNNGPVPINNRKGPDLTRYFKEASIPDCRLHDANWAGSCVADIPFIFPLAHAYLSDAKNYLFARTDDYLNGITNAGAEIVYRLGVSIEHQAKKYDTHPPADFNQWAEVCLGIIRHYNEGWANGFHHNIRYWEIWNEPGNSQMWSGTLAQYHELYKTTANAIKKQYPSLKVGGPAGVKPKDLEAFLAYCRDNKVPLDFCSQHAYNATPLAAIQNVIQAQKALDKFGFPDAEILITEWHYWNGNWRRLYDYNDPAYHEAKFTEINGPAGAAFAAATLLLFQDTTVARAHYYAGDTEEYGLFNYYGVPRKPYYAFKAFGQLLKTPQRVACTGGNKNDGLIIGAGLDAEKQTAQILLSNFESKSSRFRIKLQNLPWKNPSQAEIFAVNADKNLDSISKKRLDGPDAALEVDCPAPSLLLVRLSSANAK